MRVTQAKLTGFGYFLSVNKWAQIGEIISVFAVAAIVIYGGLQFAGDDLFARQIVVFAANVTMLAMVWSGLRLRGESLEHFGLSLRFSGWRTVFLTLLKSLAVLVLAMAGFIIGAVIMANIAGTPPKADLSSYNYLSGNLPLLIVSLISIFFVSSFGEEFIYRAFLINRISGLGNGGRFALPGAVIISSVVFGIAHFGWGWVGIGQTTFMGLALALAYLLFRRNLWPLVLAHAYMDALLIIPLYFSK